MLDLYRQVPIRNYYNDRIRNIRVRNARESSICYIESNELNSKYSIERIVYSATLYSARFIIYNISILIRFTITIRD